MVRESPRGINLAPFGRWWNYGLFCLLFVYIATCPFTNSPDVMLHRHFDAVVCFELACVVALASIWIGFWNSNGPLRRRPLVIISYFGGFGLVSTFLAALNLSAIIEPRIDFPPGHTQTFPARLPIRRVHQSRSGGVIETAPIGAKVNLAISDSDFEFMMTHLPPPGPDPNTVSGDGYFCADVTMQKSGSALRIPGVAHQALSPGSISICRPGVIGLTKK